jgi:hypothetical protein
MWVLAASPVKKSEFGLGSAHSNSALKLLNAGRPNAFVVKAYSFCEWVRVDRTFMGVRWILNSNPREKNAAKLR